jgi:predicted nucleotidyltransferase
MTRERILSTLAANRAALNARHVERAALFGSVARGEAGPHSDIDVLLEFEADAPVTVYDYAAVKRFVSDLLGGGVDVVDRANLDDRMRAAVDRDAVYAF